jgi:hypothetical protein
MSTRRDMPARYSAGCGPAAGDGDGHARGVDPTLVDPLYALPAAEFVAARNELAKRLRAEGDRATAAEVAKLRRPTATAWALNQIARERADLLDDALAAKADLRAVTEGTGRGEALDLRSATAADREATRSVIAEARARLGAEDAGLANRISSTLLAAVLDTEVLEAVRAGRLATEQDASAFSLAADPGELAEVIVLADRKPKPAPKPDEDAKRAAEEERARRRARAERERAVERLESKVERLRAAAEEAEAEARTAREAADAAERDLAAAQAALAELASD